MLKRTLLAAALCAFTVSVPVYAETIDVTINNKTVVMQQSPVRHQGQILVPLAELVRELGGSVAFDPIAHDWTAIRKDQVFTWRTNSPVVWLNGHLERLDGALVVGDELMVPMDWASHYLGTALKYDRINNRIAIDPGPVTHPGMTTPVAYTPSVVVTNTALLLNEGAPDVIETRAIRMPLTERVTQDDLEFAFVNVQGGQEGVDQFHIVGVTQPDATVSVHAVRDGNYSRLPAGDYTITADATGRFDLNFDTSKLPTDRAVHLDLQASDSVGNRGPIQRLTLPGRP